MPSYRDMKVKTGIQVIGIVDAINSYFHEKTEKTYLSLDLIVKGFKEKVNIRLPMGYDMKTIVEDELIKLDLQQDRFNNWEAQPQKA